MNVLIFVMSMLMILALLTYSKMEGFRSSVGVQKEFARYMEKTEREPLTIIAEHWYDQIAVKTVQKSASGPKAEGTSFLSLHLLFDKEAREKNEIAFQQTKALTKQLMTQLYAKEEFFKKALEERPNLLDELLDRLVEIADEFSAKKKIERPSVLANFEFNDPISNDFMYNMIKGLRLPENTPPKIVAKEEEEVSSDDEADKLSNAERDTPNCGFVSLLDFLTAAKTSKIRIYLASTNLLIAIYGDPSIANQILEKRKELYLAVRNKEMKKEEATKQFEEAFKNEGNANAYATLLNFNVTETNPSQYE